MNSLFRIAQSFWRRPRFWVFGGWYLIVVYIFLASMDVEHNRQVKALAILPVSFACVLAAMAAMHLRRLLSGPAAHLSPHFVAPHVMIGGAISLLVWLIVPAFEAWWLAYDPLQLIGLHALAGVLFALVLASPRAVLLFFVFPVVGIWALDSKVTGSATIRAYLNGEPTAMFATIALAVIAYPLCVWWHWRNVDRAVAYNDDLTFEPSQPAARGWKASWLKLRDAAIETRLRRHGLLWPVRRWQTPSLISLSERALVLVMLALLMVGAWLATDNNAAGPWLVALPASLICVFVPLGTWRYRCRALAGEVLRPVTRQHWQRQFMTAMIWDFVAWTLFGTLILALGDMGFAAEAIGLDIYQRGESWREALLAGFMVVSMQAGFLWAVATLLCGVALATIRIRYWLPWFLGLFLGLTISIGMLTTNVAMRLLHPHAQEPYRSMIIIGSMLGAFVLTGIILTAWTYRRWATMEIA